MFSNDFTASFLMDSDLFADNRLQQTARCI